MPSLPQGTSAALAAVGGRSLWYFTRGAGLVTLGLLTASVLLGIATSLDLHGRATPRFVTTALHRNVSFLAIAMLAVHVVTIVLDGFAPISWLDALVPFVGRYHSFALGLGALATDLLLLVMVSSALRSRLSFNTWRTIHWGAYLCWPVAVWHGLLIGTDRSSSWMLGLELMCVAAVLIAVIARLTIGARNRARQPGKTPDVLDGLRSLLVGGRR